MSFKEQMYSDDLDELKNKGHKTNWFKTIFEYIGIYVFFFFLSFTIINYQSIGAKLAYYWQSNFYKSTLVEDLKTSPEKLPQNRLFIPKINVDAPIQWSVPEVSINDSLVNGVSHYDGTSYPGIPGNVFITGHSSYYSWVKSDYKSVFANLDEMENNDLVYITFNNRLIPYKVIEKKVVGANDLSLLNNSKDKQILTLVTCTPIGTNLRRLVVIAEAL